MSPVRIFNLIIRLAPALAIALIMGLNWFFYHEDDERPETDASLSVPDASYYDKPVPETVNPSANTYSSFGEDGMMWTGLQGNNSAPCVDAYGRANPLNGVISIARTGAGAKVSSGQFGMTRNGGAKRHDGYDLAAAPGTPVYAVCDGTIDANVYNTGARRGSAGARDGGGYGNYIMVNGQMLDEEVGAFYAHLSTVTVAPGQTVKRGDIIGYTGTSGNAYNVPNPHLHFEIRTGPNRSSSRSAVDPGPYLNGIADNNDGVFRNIQC